MSPAASPAGADRPRASFTPAAACEVLGLAPADLARWEPAIAALRLAASLSFAELVALAVVAEASRRLGEGAGDYALGLCRLFEAMGAAPEPERLDDHVAIVGRDFARLARVKEGHLRCEGDGFIVVALRPVLAELRDQVFP